MKQNKYDDDVFFEKYSQMARSQEGLAGAGEWPTLKGMLPEFQGKRVLDLGCGYGWHCMYAAEQGARAVVGVDISGKMIAQARKRAQGSAVLSVIDYRCESVEEIDFRADSFDVVLSSLTFHYIVSFRDICERVGKCLVSGGDFVFSVEHPVFTAEGSQQWCCDAQGMVSHWPVDHYFDEGVRRACFLGETVQKYHRTLTTYINDLLDCGFRVTGLAEPEPPQALLHTVPDMVNELRRPMMLIISARRI